MSTIKPTRNTNLLKALIPNHTKYTLAMYKKARAAYNISARCAPWLRPGDVAHALKWKSPLRAHGGVRDFGWASFKVTADGRSYTVIVMADSADEWTHDAPQRFKKFVHERTDTINSES